MDDRKLGYIVLLILVLFFGGVIVYLAPSWAKADETRTILFRGVRGQSFISPQDPVRIRGVDVGKVAAVVGNGSDAHVIIETASAMHIHEGYSVRVALRGIMGETFLAIEPGDLTAKEIGSKEILLGKVEMTPPQALAYVDTLQIVVRSLAKLTTDLRTGSADRRSLIVAFMGVMTNLDSLLGSLVGMSANLDTKMASGIDTLAAVLEDATQLAANLETGVPQLVETLMSLVTKTEQLIRKTDVLLDKSEQLVMRVEDPNSLLRSDKLEQLHDQIKLIRAAIAEIQHRGLALPVRAKGM